MQGTQLRIFYFMFVISLGFVGSRVTPVSSCSYRDSYVTIVYTYISIPTEFALSHIFICVSLISLPLSLCGCAIFYYLLQLLVIVITAAVGLSLLCTFHLSLARLCEGVSRDRGNPKCLCCQLVN